MPRLDVLMPLYNRADTVAEAWQSLSAQTFTDFRVIAVDDGSTDATVVRLTDAARGDSRLEIESTEHRGIVAALNHGLSRVTAPHVVRMDGDDRCRVTRLERLLDAFDNRALGVVGSQLSAFPRERVTPAMRRYLDWQNALLEPEAIRRERYVESTLAHGTAAFTTDVLLEAGGWSDRHGPEDLDLWLRLHRQGVRFAKLAEPLYEWRLRPGSETRAERCSLDAFHICRRDHLLAELRQRGIDRVTALGRGRTLRRWAAALGAAGVRTRALSWKPGHPLPPKGEDFVVACYGVASVRARARAQLSGTEDESFLFVGS